MRKDDREGREYSCSFCGKPQDKVDKLVSGPSVYICSDCIHLCNEILRDEEAGRRRNEPAEGPTPREITRFLDQ